LEAIDAVPRSRAELLERSGVAEEDWPSAIAFIVSSGWARRIGAKRGSRYTRFGAGDAVNEAVDSTDEDEPTEEVTRPSTRTLTDDDDDLPEGVREILRALDDTPRARADILEASGVREGAWLPAIDFIMAAGFAVRTGSKRGTRYTRVGTDNARSARAGVTIARPTASTDPQQRDRRNLPALVAIGYHDIVLEALQQLGDRRAPEPKSASAEDVEVQADEVEEVEEVDTAAVLSRAGLELIDLRDRGGCLWVVDTPTARDTLTSITHRAGTQFFFAASSRACRGRAAWWTRE
jgi:hypothetical protein